VLQEERDVAAVSARARGPLLAVAAGAAFGVLACTSSSANNAPSPVQGTCEAQGYLAPSGTSCPKGTCLATGSAQPCCGSVCATCEAKGLVSQTDAGACPPGLCVSGDLTAALACCDVCPRTGGDAGAADADGAADVPADGASDGAPPAAADAAADAPAD
jgi:hypothetical protein